jgi:hypothetical protein
MAAGPGAGGPPLMGAEAVPGLNKVPVPGPSGARIAFDNPPPAPEKQLKVAKQEVAKFRRLPYAPGVMKYLSANKVADPIQQQEVFRDVTSRIVPFLIEQQWTIQQIGNRIFQVLQQNPPRGLTGLGADLGPGVTKTR